MNRFGRRPRSKQSGTTTVEFAIVGVVLMIVLFSIIEFGRLLFTFSVLNEGARRATRLAAVCQINDAAISNAAQFAALPGLNSSNVHVEYLAGNGTVIGAPSSSGGFASIRFVRVRVGGYVHALAIPILGLSVTMPEFSAVLPRESLGITREGTTTC